MNEKYILQIVVWSLIMELIFFLSGVGFYINKFSVWVPIVIGVLAASISFSALYLIYTSGWLKQGEPIKRHGQIRNECWNCGNYPREINPTGDKGYYKCEYCGKTMHQ